MKIGSIVCALLLVVPCLTLAVDCPVPDTGQTKCYDAAGNEINPCPSPGQPFYGQDAQYAPANPHSYTKLDASGNDLPDSASEWVMVRDNVTGLIWEVKEDRDGVRNYANPHDADNIYYWSDSLGDGTGTEDFINTLNQEEFGGHSDWRLPTLKELSSIVNSSVPNPGPTIDTDYFPATQSSDYWSSTISASNPSHAWSVYFYRGNVFNYGKSNRFYVRAVCGGQCGSLGNYIDNGNGTLTDTSTGLMWEIKTDDGGPRDKDNTYTWQSALSYCENLSLAGYNDWRLPNRNELHSIVEYSTYNPSIDPMFFNTVSHFPRYGSYWSSTTITGGQYSAWSVLFYKGHVSYSNKLRDEYVRAVRGGQCGSLGDSDGDTVCNDADNCPDDYNPSQYDCDNDGVGDICDPDTIDPDGDGIDVVCDNCPTITNPNQEDSDSDGLGDVCDNCPNHYNPLQEDTYPPGGNGIGDACDCEGDFDCSGGVDAVDVTAFLADFGREQYYLPCTNADSCNGDFDCDGDVDADDVSKFLEDFGREEYFNPCPACNPETPWCVYP